MRNDCAIESRPLFEEAALSHHEADPGVAGGKLGNALTSLHRCLGISSTPDAALEEVERWFSFFDWWYAAKLLEKGDATRAWSIIMDLAESFGLQRSIELGIEADYGVVQVKELYDKTMTALEHIQSGRNVEASSLVLEAADIQYRLAVERTGS